MCVIPIKKKEHVSKHQPQSALAVFPKQEVQNVGNVQMVSYQMLKAIREAIHYDYKTGFLLFSY